MVTETLYHVTDAANVDSILDDGLLPSFADSQELVFLTTSVEEAEYIGEIYDTIDEPVVLEVEVMSHKLRDDPEPHGELDSIAHSGAIPAYDVAVVA